MSARNYLESCVTQTLPIGYSDYSNNYHNNNIMPRLQEGPAPDKNNLNYRTASFSFGKKNEYAPGLTKQDLCPGSNIRFLSIAHGVIPPARPIPGGDIAQAAGVFTRTPEGSDVIDTLQIYCVLRFLHYFFYENAAQRRRIVGVVEERQQLAARQRPVF